MLFLLNEAVGSSRKAWAGAGFFLGMQSHSVINPLLHCGVSQMVQIAVATLERRLVRAEMALSQAKAHARKESKVSREENEALGSVIDRLEGVLLAQQVFLPGLRVGTEIMIG